MIIFNYLTVFITDGISNMPSVGRPVYQLIEDFKITAFGMKKKSLAQCQDA